MMNNEGLVDNRKWWSRHRSVFVFLVVGAMIFFYYTNLKDMAPEWNPKQWMQNHSTKLFIPFRMQNAASRNRTSSTQEPETKNQATVTSQTTQQVLKPAAAPQTPVPYVSPGPYLVEYPSEYHFIINEPQKCEQEKPFVVLIVQVAPRNRAHRDVIRSTWGSENLVLDKVVKLFFLLGMETGEDSQQVHEQLLQESKEQRDLIQSDFVDCYKNLTIKTMVMLEWLNSYCSSSSYATKIDSDMFLNVPNLVKLLLNAPKSNYMTGLVARSPAVFRNPKSKWYLPPEIYPHPTYPRYALGQCYILSLDLTEKLIEASRHVKALYIEDVFLGLCMQHLGIAPTNPPSFNYFHGFPLNYSRCAFSKIISTTTRSSTDRVWLWKDFKRDGPYC